MAVDTSKLARIVGSKGTSNVSGNLMEQSRYRAPMNTSPVVSAPLKSPITKPEMPMPTGQGSPTQKAWSQVNAPDQNILSKAVNVMGLPAAYTEEKLMVPLLKSRMPKEWAPNVNSYDSLLDTMGLKNTPGKLDMNDVISNTGRLVADPLNLVGGLFGKVAKYGSKIPGAAKLMQGADLAVEATKKLPVIRTLGKNFIRGFELKKENKFVDEILKNIPYRQAELAAAKIEQLKQSFSAIANDKDKGELLFDALESTTKEGEGLRAFIQRVGVDTFEPIKKEFLKAQEILKGQLDDMLKNKVISKKEYAEFASNGYVPHSGFERDLGDRLLSATGVGEKRGYLMKRTGAKGFSRNAPEVIARREIQQTSDNAIMEAMREIKTKIGIKYKNKADIPEGYVNIPDMLKEKGIDISARRWREFKGYALSKDVASHIIGDFQEVGTAYAKFEKGLNTITRPFKAAATSWNPVFSVTNKIGNLFSEVILGGMRSPKKIIQDITGIHSPQERAIIDKLKVSSTSFFSPEHAADMFKDTPLWEKVVSMPSKSVGALARKIEDSSRNTFGLDQFNKGIQKGMNEADAIKYARDRVSKYLFDYKHSLTNFEKHYVKPFFPFYTWAKNNIPLQMKSLVESPGGVAAYTKVKNAINPEGPPPGLKQGINIKTGAVDRKGRPLVYSPNLPINDLTQFNRQKALDMLNPYLKDAPQLAAMLATKGRFIPEDLYSGKARTKANLPWEEQARDLIKSYAGSYARPFRTGQKIQEEGGIDSENPMKSIQNLLRFWLVGSTNAVDEKAVKKREITGTKYQDSALRSRIKEIQMAPMSKERKVKELKRLRSYQ